MSGQRPGAPIAWHWEQFAVKMPAPAATSVQPSGTKPNGKTPTPVATQPAKSDLDPKLVAAGEKIYFAEDNGCADCHKMNGVGGKKGPDAAVDDPAHEQAVEHRNHCRFGRRKPAEPHAPQYEHRRRETPACIQQARPERRACSKSFAAATIKRSWWRSLGGDAQ